VFDLGRALGVGAHVTALRRTRSGPFRLGAAQPLDEVLEALAAGGPVALVALEDALDHLPRCTVDARTALMLEQGKRPSWEELGGQEPGRVALLRPDGGLLAVAEPRADGTVRTLRVFGVETEPESARIH
jgi:tRNA pseudouridine55 synthase